MSALTPTGDTFVQVIADLPDVPDIPAWTDSTTWNGWANVWIDTNTRDELWRTLMQLGDHDSADDIAALPSLLDNAGLYSLNGYCVTINADKTARSILMALYRKTTEIIDSADYDTAAALTSLYAYQRDTGLRYPATFCREWLPNGSSLPY